MEFYGKVALLQTKIVQDKIVKSRIHVAILSVPEHEMQVLQVLIICMKLRID